MSKPEYVPIQTNHYTCPKCATEWQDDWNCACNDECPSCGLSDIEPHESQDIEGLKICECGNCGFRCDIGDLDPCSNIWERLDFDAGRLIEVPAGDCPECGAFSYLENPPEEERERIQILIARGLVNQVMMSGHAKRYYRVEVIDYDVEGADNDEITKDSFGTKCFVYEAQIDSGFLQFEDAAAKAGAHE